MLHSERSKSIALILQSSIRKRYFAKEFYLKNSDIWEGNFVLVDNNTLSIASKIPFNTSLQFYMRCYPFSSTVSNLILWKLCSTKSLFSWVSTSNKFVGYIANISFDIFSWYTYKRNKWFGRLLCVIDMVFVFNIFAEKLRLEMTLKRERCTFLF